jgi:hypothetical protein
MAGQIQLGGQQTGTPGTPVQQIGPFSLTCSGVQSNEQVNLTTGNNTVEVPAGSAGFMVITPTGGTTPILYGGVNIAQSGLALVVVIDQANPVTSFVLNASAPVTVTVQAF